MKGKKFYLFVLVAIATVLLSMISCSRYYEKKELIEIIKYISSKNITKIDLYKSSRNRYDIENFCFSIKESNKIYELSRYLSNADDVREPTKTFAVVDAKVEIYVDGRIYDLRFIIYNSKSNDIYIIRNRWTKTDDGYSAWAQWPARIPGYGEEVLRLFEEHGCL